MAVHIVSERLLEGSMNHSLHSADRSTHVRIVAVALAAAIAVTGFGIYSRFDLDVGHHAASAIATALPAASLPSTSLPLAVTLSPDRLW